MDKKTETFLFLGGAAALLAYFFWPKTAAAAPTVAPPATSTVNLQPGGTTVSVAKGGTVTLVLPSGATWNTTNPISPVQANSTLPTGNQGYSLVMSAVAGVTAVTASWTDSSGSPQVTTINIATS